MSNNLDNQQALASAPEAPGPATLSSGPTYSGSELCRLQAFEVLALLRSKRVSPRELLDAAFARILQVEAAINAMPTRCEARAYQAAEAGSTGAAPAFEGTALAGLPLCIKDLTAVAGVRTTFGAAAYADHVPVDSDYVVERIEGRGGIVIGKTNTPEMGVGGNTYNPVFGATFNPWNLSLNAGGSSGGAAAALATGEVWLSHGSDSAGSLRTPAAYCGIVGLRPSPGRVPYGPRNMAFSIEGVDGPMARSVRDCALFLDAMSAFDPRCPLSYPEAGETFEACVAAQSDCRIRIAYSPNLGGLSPVDREMADHLSAALQRIQRCGAQVEEVQPDVNGLVDTYEVFRALNWLSLARTVGPQITATFGPNLVQNIAYGRRLTVDQITDAHLNRARLYDRVTTLLGRFDVLACPVVGCLPQPQVETWVREIDGQPLHSYLDWLRFSYLATTLGLPAMSVPVGLGPRGLPVGLQLIGQPRGEARLLACARAIELAMGGPLGPIDPAIKKNSFADLDPLVSPTHGPSAHIQ